MERDVCVLVVDDDHECRAIHRSILEGAGYRVRTAPDGLAALEVLAMGGVHAAVVDGSMPGMGGIELCRRIRAGNSADLPVILLTAVRDAAIHLIAVSAGVDRVLRKPISSAALVGHVAAALCGAKEPHGTLG